MTLPARTVPIVNESDRTGQVTRTWYEWFTDLVSSAGSSLIGFIASGTGAVERTIQTKLRDTVCVFDYMTEAEIAQVRAGTVTTNLATAIQAAIDACSAMATTTQQRSRTTLYFPDGVYNITAQVVVKANVNILCDGYFYNSLASTTEFCLWFKAGSACDRLVLWGNSQGGVLFGDNATNNDLRIGDVRLLNMGESTSQYACRFVGYNFTVESLDIDGGNVGLDIGDGTTYGASDIRIDKAILYSASTGLRVGVGSEHVCINHLDIDTPSYLGIQIDSCTDVTIPDFICFFNDAEGGSCYDRGYAIEIGTYSAAGGVAGLNLSGRVINTAKTDNVTGTALKLSNTKNTTINLDASNTTLGTGNAHRIVQALEYGAGVEASTIVTGNFASTLTVSSGTVVGGLRYWNGSAEVNAALLNLPHRTAPASPVNGDMWTTTAGLYVRINGATVGPLS